jgi:hypothetical protein
MKVKCLSWLERNRERSSAPARLVYSPGNTQLAAALVAFNAPSASAPRCRWFYDAPALLTHLGAARSLGRLAHIEAPFPLVRSGPCPSSAALLSRGIAKQPRDKANAEKDSARKAELEK